MNRLLKEILDNKRDEVRIRKGIFHPEELKARLGELGPTRGFASPIVGGGAKHKVIAEIKRISPGTGFCRKEFNPTSIAKGYVEAGASALSVLTDSRFFGGSLEILAQVSREASIPVLRKDFIIDPYQIYEARVFGADAVLLMAVNFESPSELEDMAGIAQEAGLEVLLEIHGEDEISFIPSGSISVGINNRDFRSDNLNIDMSATRELASKVGKCSMLVSESGIRSREVIEEFESLGVNAFLIGSRFMESDNPGQALKELIS